ncbi:uncharacterized protein LOC110248659 [Exaiptasia diaphana]|uniref:Jun-like transcription factor domain-containing protein n=1 Tax=Exaiptasia diaphana TaxID=2652724 RepID=A0A913XWA0_EXADI|nr:uncharacterized protein LOC110248659 [Exaiptasia diaphana]
METMFYDEPAILPTTNRKSMDSTALKLNLCTDKMLDIGAKRDELGFSDLADFLVSPDIGISSPDLENLVWKEWNSSIAKPATEISDIHYTVKQEPCVTPETVTKEQEVFAFGFTEALKRLQETEQQESEVQPDDCVVPDSSESSDSASSDEISTIHDDCDAKITFISYTFDSKEPLPSFQEAFSKIILRKSNDICLQIKLGKREEFPNQEQTTSDGQQHWNPTSNEKNELSGFEWDNVETVDEGFCSREEIPVSLQEDKYLGDPNLSMSWATSDSVEMTSDLFSDKANEPLLDNLSSNTFSNNFINDIEILDQQKHWMSA